MAGRLSAHFAAMGSAALFLASDDASFVTGTASLVDGGLTLRTEGHELTLPVEGGDAVTVANREDEAVYMMGELVKPAALPLRHGRLTLAQAIAESGGLGKI